ncbi:hypothetical protein APICC_05657 [Apis cerana cerana]|uniref:Uncharacterized protein n=1 Tax=Apis cerana cerana TaxID=94128 RepID=A0A2A3EJM9_APICC|nr:hypothetical protein APICC_05657 [Apis cerana cerana]
MLHKHGSSRSHSSLLYKGRGAFLKSMSEFPVPEGGENGDMHTVMENFQKKNMVTGRSHVTHHPQVTSSSQRDLKTNDYAMVQGPRVSEPPTDTLINATLF